MSDAGLLRRVYEVVLEGPQRRSGAAPDAGPFVDVLGPASASTTFSIAPDGSGSAAGASCNGASCSATAAGTYTMTGSDGLVIGTTTLTVTAAPTVASLTLSPTARHAVPAYPVSYAAEG